MKTALIFLAGLTAAIGVVLATRGRANDSGRRPVEELARQLEGAWADHHTVV